MATVLRHVPNRSSLETVIEALEIAAVAYLLHRLTKLDCALRVAAGLGFLFGAALVASNLDLPITARTTAEWALAGFLLFQREIRRLCDRQHLPGLPKNTPSPVFAKRFASASLEEEDVRFRIANRSG